MDVRALVEGLDPDQREAVETDASPLAILAPAGSGKTRVLSHRIARRVADGSADASHVLAITFTRRAAGELQRRLGRLGLRARPTAGTFHGVAWSVLAQRWADQGRPRPDLVPDPVRVLGPLLDERAATTRPDPSSRPRARIEDVAAEISWARARLVSAATYVEAARHHDRRPPLGPDAMAELMASYDETKRRRRLVDFDDLLELCGNELRRDAAFAAAQRWRFRHLFVDEFQDVNPLQFSLLEAWRGGRSDVCVVGDPNQAIYGWNGADPTLLARFPELVGGATVVRLGTTYRSTPQVVATAGVLLVEGAAHPRAARADGSPPQVHAFATAAAEAAGIAKLVAAHRPGRRWSSCAVLVRTHAQLGLIERALTAAGIPCRARGDRPLLDDPGVQSVLRASTPTASLRAFADDLQADLDADLEPGGAGVGALRQLAALAEELLATAPAATVAAFRTWLVAGGADEAERADGVELVTFHAAKGLEWPLVIVAGLETGLVPHVSARGEAAKAEEVRLLYVALTRAEHELHVTWAAERGTGARRQRRPSPLLAAITAAAKPEPAAPPPPGLGAPRRVAQVSPELDETLERLRAWRASAAVAAGVPEHAVCTDDDLRRLVRARPATEGQLADVLGPLAARRLAPRLLPLLA